MKYGQNTNKFVVLLKINKALNFIVFLFMIKNT